MEKQTVFLICRTLCCFFQNPVFFSKPSFFFIPVETFSLVVKTRIIDGGFAISNDLVAAEFCGITSLLTIGHSIYKLYINIVFFDF